MMKFKSAAVESMKEFSAKITGPFTRTYKKVRSDEFKVTMKNAVHSGYSKVLKYTKSFLSAFKVQAMKTFMDVADGVLKITIWAIKILALAALASLAVTLLKPYSGIALRALLGVSVSHIVLSILNDTFKKMTAPETMEEIPATVSETEAE